MLDRANVDTIGPSGSSVGSGAVLTAGGQDIAVFLSQSIAVGTITSGSIYTNGSAIVVFINITNVGTGTLTVSVFGVDPVSNGNALLLASAALASNALTTLMIGPGLPVTANASNNALVPRTVRITATAATGPVVASVGASIVAE